MSAPVYVNSLLRTSRSSVRCYSKLPLRMIATTTRDWEASRYLRFGQERTRPARDLLSQIHLKSPLSIVDLGCGPGNSTELLSTRYPEAKLIGIDSSPNMIQKARTALPGVDFQLGDLRSFTPDEMPDLIYSNAVLQWLRPHERIPTIRRLLGLIRDGGVVAVQVPDNFDEPTHSAMREMTSHPSFMRSFGSKYPGNTSFPRPIELYNAFTPHCSTVNVWHIVYEHRLDSHEAIVDWFKSSGLRPFLDLLTESHQEEFLANYLAKIKQYYPSLAHGGVLLSFPRLFIVLTK